jgi:hypothetical protein
MNWKLFLTVAGVLFLTACTIGANCSQGEACQYYQGSRGVVMEPQDLPNTLYYDGGEPKENNAVEFPVRLRNVGASHTYGATFFTGFDPQTFSLYKIGPNGNKEPFSVPRTGGCQLVADGFSFFNPSQNGPSFNFGVSGDCGNFFVRGDGNSQQVGVTSAFLQDTSIEDWMQENLGVSVPDADITATRSGGEWEIGFGVTGALIDLWGHGKVLVAIASEFALDVYNGAEYTIPGENPETPNGGEAYKTFRAEMKNWPAGTDQYTFRYDLKNCYAYTTFVSPAICIDPNPQAPQSGKVCRGDRSISMGSQGAPVAVTNVEQDNTGSSVILNFDVSNVGNGRVIDLGMLQACSPYYPGKKRPSMYDTVYIGQAYLGNDPLDCGRSTIRLQDGRAEFTCRYEFRGEYDTDSAYTRPLKMELWYGYSERIRRSINVRRIG